MTPSSTLIQMDGRENQVVLSPSRDTSTVEPTTADPASTLKPKLPLDLVLHMARLLRDGKIELLNNHVSDDLVPDQIMRTMQRVCRSWYAAVTPLLYEESIFGHFYLSPPIRVFIDLLEKRQLAGTPPLPSSGHPLEWPLKDRILWVLSHIKRLRFSHYYRSVEYSYDLSAPWSRMWWRKSDVIDCHEGGEPLFPSLTGTAIDVTDTIGETSEDYPISGMQDLLLCANTPSPTACLFGSPRYPHAGTLLQSNYWRFEDVTFHIRPGCPETLVNYSNPEASSLTIDFARHTDATDPDPAQIRHAHGRLNEITHMATRIRAQEFFDHRLWLRTISLPKVQWATPEHELAFCERMDTIFGPSDASSDSSTDETASSQDTDLQSVPTREPKLRWRYLKQSPDADGVFNQDPPTDVGLLTHGNMDEEEETSGEAE